MLHPQARALLDFIEARGVPPVHLQTPAEARAAYRDRRAATQPSPPAVGEVRELQADGPHGAIPLRLYRPPGVGLEALPVLVYFHGGGWVIGDLDTHDTLCRELANGARCAVVAVDYRLAPEHPFPAAVDDAIAATRFVHAQATALGLDDRRIAVGGDSAGGNLAAVVAVVARDAGDLPLVHQLLIYPATDQHRGSPSHATNGEGYLLTNDTMAWFGGHYLPDPASHGDWRASPLLHPDLSKLPTALVVTAGFDLLRDEGAAYADKLSAAGTASTYVCFERQIHGFITMGRVLDEARSAVALCAAEVRRAFATASGG